MRRIVIGIMAHVDAGKTTLSEALLYKCNAIKQMGRVDNKNAFLDTNPIEKDRGITIYSKEARFVYKDLEIILIDTPGHVDFSTEMERSLQVIDYALLVVSASSAVQSHTLTLWKLLNKYCIPTFVFVNKMDQVGVDRNIVLQKLQSKLQGGFVDFTNNNSEDFYESIAVNNEDLLELYLKMGTIDDNNIRNAIKSRVVFPCFIGSAIKAEGITMLLEGLYRYCEVNNYKEEFGGVVYKISRDEQGTRLAHIKITGGCLKVKDVVEYESRYPFKKEQIQDKINQIRLYSGIKYETVNQVTAGDICIVTGLNHIGAGQKLGSHENSFETILEPVLSYSLEVGSKDDVAILIPKLKLLEEEEPTLQIIWNESTEKIQINLMGEIQMQVLQTIIKERFDYDVSFGKGKIVYKETILDTVEGVGHFEPLRHYAEVHLLLEPLERGKGIEYQINCNEQVLAYNFQKTVISHLMEKEHCGVKIGAPITDIRITLASGKAHQRHTEGGDFRQATYRAVRNGLKNTRSIILEPYYDFVIEVPESQIGRAINDIDIMKGDFKIEEARGNMAIIVGIVPVATSSDYPKEVLSYTKGEGSVSFSFRGYDVCHNSEKLITDLDYDSERDIDNPTGSIFCSNGAGFFVPWYEVKKYMHLESILENNKNDYEIEKVIYKPLYDEGWIDESEVEDILERTFNNNSRKDNTKRKIYKSKVTDTIHMKTKSPNYNQNYNNSKEECLLVDAYNIIHSWEELKELIEINIDSARNKLIDEISNYQSIKSSKMVVVFDATKVKEGKLKEVNYNNITVVYTKEKETADQYIERFAFNNRDKYNILVATSDLLEQMTVRSVGGRVVSARELKEIIEMDKKLFRDKYDL